jgi:hypothetical protein
MHVQSYYAVTLLLGVCAIALPWAHALDSRYVEDRFAALSSALNASGIQEPASLTLRNATLMEINFAGNTSAAEEALHAQYNQLVSNTTVGLTAEDLEQFRRRQMGWFRSMFASLFGKMERSVEKEVTQMDQDGIFHNLYHNICYHYSCGHDDRH